MVTIQHSVELADLRFYAYHGYYPEEQVLGNEFFVSIGVNFSPIDTEEEQLGGTVDYETLYRIAKREMELPRKLLETVAGSIITQIREKFPYVSGIDLKITKNRPPFGGDMAKASVRLSWNNSLTLD